MKLRSSCLVPAALGLCAALVVGAMTWLTFNTLTAERERAHAEVRADLQERTRLALWRMDSLGASILLDESTWPETASRLPVRRRFAYSPAGSLISPATGPEADELKNRLGTGRNAIEALRRIAHVAAPAPEVSIESKKNALQSYNTYQNEERLQMHNQATANWVEQSVRSKAVESTLNRAASKISGIAKDANRKDEANAPSADPFANAPDGTDPFAAADQEHLPLPRASAVGSENEQIVGQPRAAWVEGELYLARRVSDASNETFFDGAWIDDAALRAMFLHETADLFVSASLHPADGPGSDGMVLASFPFRLAVPPLEMPSFRPREATVLSLAAAWGAALLALFATSLVIRGVMRLSERRASFVSAVTHELRTPLTTFRLYSEMLESGAVKEANRGDYLRVLSREADRLSHLVENVLAFSRIERGNARSHVVEIEIGAILEHCRERLEARLGSAGLTLAMDSSCTFRVRADTAAVEHILFNLIDNAAKYAANSEPPVVNLHARKAGRFVEIIVADHGPGIPPAERRRIFHPFHKSAREAAESQPGVGLGLALSRRLAKAQGGGLLCNGTGKGAEFVLRLPQVS